MLHAGAFARILERVRVATGPSIGVEPEGPAPGPGGDILRLRGGGCGVTGTDSHPPQVRSSSVSACVGEKVEKGNQHQGLRGGLHRGHPQVVAHKRQLVQGVGAGGARRVRDLAQFGVMRARFCPAEAAVWRAADVLAGRPGAGGAHAELQ